ncbi:MAG TPA: lytic transglycosylase domain-containing protein [Pyrinomonadaceae bacterium]|jgi:Zn-finger nucleic acid-binding protein
MTRPVLNSRYLLLFTFVLVFASSAAAQTTEIKLKLADGSYMTVDDAWESPQGIWYRQGRLSHLLTKEKVTKIERTTTTPDAPAQTTTNEDDHFEVPDIVAENKPTSGTYDKPSWIYLKGGARVEADSATQSPAGVWYKRGSMSIFIDATRVDRIEVEDAQVIAQSGKKASGWSTGRAGLDSLIRQNGYKYNVDPYLIFLVMEQESHFNTRALSPKGARGLMQLMPGTAARFGARRPHDAAQNISAGTRYLRELLNRFNNRVDLVLASYNAGEGAVAKFGNKVPPYRETRNYVKKISYRYKRTTARTRKPA